MLYSIIANFVMVARQVVYCKFRHGCKSGSCVSRQYSRRFAYTDTDIADFATRPGFQSKNSMLYRHVADICFNIILCQKCDISLMDNYGVVSFGVIICSIIIAHFILKCAIIISL
jgi:hypothetical protein